MIKILKCSDFKTFFWSEKYYLRENLYESQKQIHSETDETRDVLAGLGVRMGGAGEAKTSFFAGHFPSVVPGP